MILKHTGNLIDPDKALKLAEQLNNDDDDDDLVYKVKHDPKRTDYSLVEIYEEDSIFVGYL